MIFMPKEFRSTHIVIAGSTINVAAFVIFLLVQVDLPNPTSFAK